MSLYAIPTPDAQDLTPGQWLAQWISHADARSQAITGAPLGEIGRGHPFKPPWQSYGNGRRRTRRVPERQYQGVQSDHGESWPSLKAAAEALGLKPPTISQAISQGWKAKGRRLWKSAQKSA